MVLLNSPSRICRFFKLVLQGSSVLYVGHAPSAPLSSKGYEFGRAQSEDSLPNSSHSSPPLITHTVFMSGFASCLNFQFSFMRFCSLVPSFPFIVSLTFPLFTSGSHLLVASLWVSCSTVEMWHCVLICSQSLRSSDVLGIPLNQKYFLLPCYWWDFMNT